MCSHCRLHPKPLSTGSPQPSAVAMVLTTAPAHVCRINAWPRRRNDHCLFHHCIWRRGFGCLYHFLSPTEHRSQRKWRTIRAVCFEESGVTHNALWIAVGNGGPADIPHAEKAAHASSLTNRRAFYKRSMASSATTSVTCEALPAMPAMSVRQSPAFMGRRSKAIEPHRTNSSTTAIATRVTWPLKVFGQISSPIQWATSARYAISHIHFRYRHLNLETHTDGNIDQALQRLLLRNILDPLPRSIALYQLPGQFRINAPFLGLIQHRCT